MDNVQHSVSIMNQPLSQTFRELLDIWYGPEIKGKFRTYEKSLNKLVKEENNAGQKKCQYNDNQSPEDESTANSKTPKKCTSNTPQTLDNVQHSVSIITLQC
jgi:hypothetical protein